MVNNTTIGISKQLKLGLTRLKKHPRQSYEEVIAELTSFRILFKGDVLKIIDRLQKSSGVQNRAEVVIDALKLYDEIEKIAAKDGKIRIDVAGTKILLTIPRA